MYARPFAQERFLQAMESKRVSEHFKNLQTEGGYCSEADMQKPVSEGGLSMSAN